MFFYPNFEGSVDGIVDDETIALPLAEGVSLQMVHALGLVLSRSTRSNSHSVRPLRR